MKAFFQALKIMLHMQVNKQNEEKAHEGMQTRSFYREGSEISH